MGKPGFENREDSILKTTSWVFRTIRSQSTVMQKIITSTITPQKRKNFDCDLVRKDESCGFWSKLILHAEINQRFIHIWELSDYLGSHAGRKTINWSVNRIAQNLSFWRSLWWKIPSLWLRRTKILNIEIKPYEKHLLEYPRVSVSKLGRKSTMIHSNLFKTKNFFIGISIEELKPVGLADKGRGVWLSRKNIHSFFFEVRSIRSDLNGFSPQQSSTSVMFQT